MKKGLDKGKKLCYYNLRCGASGTAAKMAGFQIRSSMRGSAW